MCGQGIAACLEDWGEGFNVSYLDVFIRGKGKGEEEGFEGCFIPPNPVIPLFQSPQIGGISSEGFHLHLNFFVKFALCGFNL